MGDIHDVLRVFAKREKDMGFSKDIQKIALHATVDVVLNEVYDD